MTLQSTASMNPPAQISRAVNVSVASAQVIAMCTKHKAEISAIETLPSGGTRVVLMNASGAAKIVRAFGSKVLTGTVPRTHWLKARHSAF